MSTPRAPTQLEAMSVPAKVHGTPAMESLALTLISVLLTTGATLSTKFAKTEKRPIACASTLGSATLAVQTTVTKTPRALNKITLQMELDTSARATKDTRAMEKFAAKKTIAPKTPATDTGLVLIRELTLTTALALQVGTVQTARQILQIVAALKKTLL